MVDNPVYEIVAIVDAQFHKGESKKFFPEITDAVMITSPEVVIDFSDKNIAIANCAYYTGYAIPSVLLIDSTSQDRQKLETLTEEYVVSMAILPKNNREPQYYGTIIRNMDNVLKQNVFTYQPSEFF